MTQTPPAPGRSRHRRLFACLAILPVVLAFNACTRVDGSAQGGYGIRPDAFQSSPAFGRFLRLTPAWNPAGLDLGRLARPVASLARPAASLIPEELRPVHYFSGAAASASAPPSEPEAGASPADETLAPGSPAPRTELAALLAPAARAGTARRTPQPTLILVASADAVRPGLPGAAVYELAQAETAPGKPKPTPTPTPAAPPKRSSKAAKPDSGATPDAKAAPSAEDIRKALFPDPKKPGAKAVEGTPETPTVPEETNNTIALDTFPYHYANARRFVDLEEYARAADEFQKALRIEPGNLAGLLSFGDCLEQLNQPAKALVQYEEAAKENPTEPRPLLKIGNLHLKDGNPDALQAARKAYEAALDRNPEYKYAFYNLGLLAVKQKKIPEAIQAFEKVLAIDDQFAGAHQNLGMLLLEQKKDIPGAMKHLSRYVDLGGKDADSVNSLLKKVAKSTGNVKNAPQGSGETPAAVSGSPKTTP